MKKLLLLTLIILAVSGCDVTWKSNPGNTTASMSTPYGTVDLKMAENLTPQEQVLLSQAIATGNITQLEIVKQEAIDNAGKRRRDVIAYLILTIWVVCGCVTAVVCVTIIKGAKS